MDNLLKIYNGYIEERDDEVYVDEDGVISDGASDDDDESATKTFYPTCRFCGKQQFPDAAYRNQIEANEAATIRCDCSEARQYQSKKEAEEKRENNIIKLRQTLDDFSEYCSARNTELDGKLYDTLLSMGISVLDGVIASVSLKFRKMKVNIGTNNKGNIVIAFTYSDGSKMEVL